jgi:hypothetical protein
VQISASPGAVIGPALTNEILRLRRKRV